MKNRLKAILLATGLTVGMLGTCAYAEDATEAVTGTATEAVDTEAAEAAAEEAEEAASELSQDAGTAAEGTEAQGVYAAYYDSMKEAIPQTLQALSTMTDAQLNEILENGTNASEMAMVAAWQSVQEELGSFVEVKDQTVTEEGNVVTINNLAVYDGVGEDVPVYVEYVYDVQNNTASLSWDIQYPMSTLLTQAGLNTLMGVGIVFLVLIFLSLLIAQLHWIPDLLNKKEKEKAAAQAAVPVQTVTPAPMQEAEEDLTDDLELVAVISAAIAASENTSTDGFVVRSIKKANRRKWQNA